MASSSDTFLSHPGVLLRDHLVEVASLAERFALEATGDEQFASLAYLVGLTHDLGKYTSFFQRKLKSQIDGQGRSRDPKASHAPISSLASAWLTMKRFSDPFFPIMAYISVRYHHGSLPSLDGAADDLVRDMRSDIIGEQLSDMRRADIFTELEDIGLGDLHDFLSEDRRGELDHLVRKMRLHTLYVKMNPQEGWRRFYRTLILFSSLTDADKRDAGRYGSIVRVNIPEDAVVRYKIKVFKNPSDQMGRIRENLFRKVSEFKPEGKIITLRAPTGSGKTLSGFHLSLKMRKEGRRVVYSLPFVNIIEQNYSVLKSVLEESMGRAGPDVILKYHHLYFPPVEGRSVDEQLMLAESFESEVVVTTFVQLLNSLATNSNSILKKLHNLANSVIILDEVQSIPAEYWKFVRTTLEAFTSLTRARVLMMTATMPLLLGKGLPGISLKTSLNRYSIHPTDVRSLDELRSLFLKIWPEVRSLLVVLNTIRTSIDVYRELKGLVGDEAEVFYLSANIVPKERAHRIERIRKILEEGRKVLLVSTQVVEAGVDLDFDAAIRDVAPLDSIVQVAGRCNRHGVKGRGKVFVLRLDDGSHARRIYGRVLIDVVEEVLRSRSAIEEKELSEVMDAYYSLLEERLDLNDRSSDLIKRAQLLDFDAFSSFSIIEDQSKFPIFIELDDNATNALEDFRRAYRLFKRSNSLKEMFKRRAELRRARIAVEGYMVSVREPPIEKDEYGLRVVGRDEVEAYYDMETGFKLDRGGSEFW